MSFRIKTSSAVHYICNIFNSVDFDSVKDHTIERDN